VRNTPVAELQDKILVEINSGQESAPLNRRPLRVCMVAYTFYETDSRVIRYAESLVQRGDQVDVFSLGKVGASAKETLHGVRIWRLQGRVFDETGRFSYLWRVLLFLARALYQVSMHDLSQKYDLVHVHSVPDFLVFTALFPRLRGVPVILDIRDILPEFYASKFGVSERSIGFRFLCLVERLCARFASHVIVASHAWRERLLSRSVKAGQCTLVLNVPDRSIFVQSERKKDAKDRVLLLYHGTFNQHQGLDVAVRAFAKIKDLAPDAEFHVYGDGPSKSELGSLIEQLHLENRVVLHERRPLWEIPKIVETARLGIVPKRKDNFGNEAFSTKILEFMAMGVPVIVSDTNVDRYYFDDSIVRFFRAEDEDDLARCILDLIQHPDKRVALVECAAKFVSQNHWALKKQDYFNLVDGLLASTKF
jgi:glycosyltransferase involved in cell wall biosynthesis